MIITILGFLSPFTSIVYGQSPDLSDQHQRWIAEKIFTNECNSDTRCLTSWNPGETFPSLGIGHFIWYQRDQKEIYTESFPDLLDYYTQQGIPLPQWLGTYPPPDSPWSSREQLYEEYDQARLTELREFLQDTMPVQAAFIARRQQSSLGKLLANSPATQRAEIESLFQGVATANAPYGMYALVDYVNFKGEGISQSERYRGQGWGLLQVLQHMLDDNSSAALMERFASAAQTVLQRRVDNAPPERNEQRWLKGWFARVDSYIPPAL
ncbi:MAG: hypothetical protein JKY98_10775 [Gammaproteobacteria bacterium]|nr:hypothetical protein [Gammaproteobacteria bacterium]